MQIFLFLNSVIATRQPSGRAIKDAKNTEVTLTFKVSKTITNSSLLSESKLVIEKKLSFITDCFFQYAY